MQRAADTAFNMESSSALIMSVSGTGGESGKRMMTVISETTQKKPDARMTAGMLLTACRDFYKRPENEEEFQKWMRTGRPNC